MVGAIGFEPMTSTCEFENEFVYNIGLAVGREL